MLPIRSDPILKTIELSVVVNDEPRIDNGENGGGREGATDKIVSKVRKETVLEVLAAISHRKRGAFIL